MMSSYGTKDTKMCLSLTHTHTHTNSTHTHTHTHTHHPSPMNTHPCKDDEYSIPFLCIHTRSYTYSQNLMRAHTHTHTHSVFLLVKMPRDLFISTQSASLSNGINETDKPAI